MSMKLKSSAVCGLLLWVASSVAQAQAPESQGRLGRNSPIPNGIEGFVLDPAFIPDSLDELIAGAKLVVEVTVISAFPTTITDRPDPATFRGVMDPVPYTTDFVVAPKRVLKGQFAADRLVVNQLGGQREGRASGRAQTYTYYTGAYPGGLMQPGQRYILFLNDPGPIYPERPQRDGLPRFEISIGVFGVVLVEQDKVELSRDLPFRNNYREKSAEQFMDEIATKAPLTGPERRNSREIERLGIINSGGAP